MATTSGTIYSAYGAAAKPSGSNTYRQIRAYMSYSYDLSADEEKVTFTIKAGAQMAGGSAGTKTGTLVIKATDYSNAVGYGAFAYKGATTIQLKSKTYTYERLEEDYDITIYAVFSLPADSHWYGTYTTNKPSKLTVTIPARRKRVINFNVGSGQGTIPSVNKFWGIDVNLPSEVPTYTGYAFLNWSYGGNTYLPSQLYTDNPAVGETEPIVFTAQYTAVFPPTCDHSEVYDHDGYARYIKNFSNVSVDVSNIKINYEGRTFASAVLYVGSAYATKTTSTDGTITVTPTESGVLRVLLKLTDSDGAVKEYDLGTIEVENPTWKATANFNEPVPDSDVKGNPKIRVKAKNFETSTAEADVFDIIEAVYVVSGTNGDWDIDVTLTEDYIPSNQRTVANPTGIQIKVTYDHTDQEEKDYRKAFFNTTRNSNYSNGISGNMFVGGVTDNSNFSSRVWWSYVNNPLYFPDLNYIEVGSNDTQVMGLIKVGDYLGAIKQSKTTDTAIYLLYPTSFDDETTYAVKQGVQGVGALGKYSFNILGDETLFLSPNGIMAIVPSEDEEHKVQNRSFYVDGKLLKEPNLENSYSFVFDSKYYLAVDNKCYVLDGNQKNSWGNDKTNLVYECYYLENIPADCFVKYNNQLWFNNAEYLCRVKDENDLNPYVDSMLGNDVDVPVKAEWSTILDDDGSLHYYKTMNKKGNVVSVLPRASEHTEVLIKKDNEEPILINRTFSEASDIPSELYVNKKFKKYKRLQFIIRNEEAESFGVDSITKSYSLGNYAKR